MYPYASAPYPEASGGDDSSRSSASRSSRATSASEGPPFGVPTFPALPQGQAQEAPPPGFIPDGFSGQPLAPKPPYSSSQSGPFGPPTSQEPALLPFGQGPKSTPESQSGALPPPTGYPQVEKKEKSDAAKCFSYTWQWILGLCCLVKTILVVIILMQILLSKYKVTDSVDWLDKNVFSTQANHLELTENAKYYVDVTMTVLITFLVINLIIQVLAMCAAVKPGCCLLTLIIIFDLVWLACFSVVLYFVLQIKSEVATELEKIKPDRPFQGISMIIVAAMVIRLQIDQDIQVYDQGKINPIGAMKLIDAFSKEYKCCGVLSYRDWWYMDKVTVNMDKILFYEANLGTYTRKLPGAAILGGCFVVYKDVESLKDKFKTAESLVKTIKDVKAMHLCFTPPSCCKTPPKGTTAIKTDTCYDSNMNGSYTRTHMYKLFDGRCAISGKHVTTNASGNDDTHPTSTSDATNASLIAELKANPPLLLNSDDITSLSIAVKAVLTQMWMPDDQHDLFMSQYAIDIFKDRDLKDVHDEMLKDVCMVEALQETYKEGELAVYNLTDSLRLKLRDAGIAAQDNTKLNHVGCVTKALQDINAWVSTKIALIICAVVFAIVSIVACVVTQVTRDKD